MSIEDSPETGGSAFALEVPRPRHAWQRPELLISDGRTHRVETHFSTTVRSEYSAPSGAVYVVWIDVLAEIRDPDHVREHQIHDLYPFVEQRVERLIHIALLARDTDSSPLGRWDTPQGHLETWRAIKTRIAETFAGHRSEDWLEVSLVRCDVSLDADTQAFHEVALLLQRQADLVQRSRDIYGERVTEAVAHSPELKRQRADITQLASLIPQWRDQAGEVWSRRIAILRRLLDEH